MTTENQDIEYTRGDALDVEVTVTLDQGRTLDGGEDWLWVFRASEIGPVLVTKSSPTGVEIDGGTSQPTVHLLPEDFPVGTFPASRTPLVGVHELQMTKGTKPETTTRGAFKLISDVAV